MKYFLLMAVTLLFATGAIFAQGFPGMGGANLSTTMLKTDKGLFALRSGVLVKYDATTLKQVGELQIFGPAPEMPADRTDFAAFQAYRTDMQKRLAPAVMIPTKDSLLIVIGDLFGRVNQETMKTEAKASLTTPADPAADPGAAPAPQPRMAQEPAPGYCLDANTLYLMRSKEMLSINIVDGTITARAPLAKELQPVQMNPGRGGNRGNRGGGPANPPANPPAGAPGGAPAN